MADKAEAIKVTKLLERLFSAFPTAQRADDLLTVRTYLETLAPFSLEAVERSVDQFVRGAVPTHDGRFAPSAAELARNVQQWQDAIQLRDEPPKPLASGLLNVDFGHGPIDMTRLTLKQQDDVLRTGKPPADLRIVGGVDARLKRVE